jgi:acyl carrier protein
VTDPLTEKVLAAVASVRRIPREQISVDRSLQELGFDSLDTTVLLFELEKQFQISIPDEGVRSVRTVRDVVDGVARLIASTSRDSVASESKP